MFCQTNLLTVQQEDKKKSNIHQIEGLYNNQKKKKNQPTFTKVIERILLDRLIRSQHFNIPTRSHARNALIPSS